MKIQSKLPGSVKGNQTLTQIVFYLSQDYLFAL